MTKTEINLLKALAEFFLDSLREDAADVANWCDLDGSAVDDIVEDIERLLGMKP